MNILVWLGLRKPAPAAKPKRWQPPPRVSVLLRDGRIVVHHARSRTLYKDGGLGLHDREFKDGGTGNTVADYAPGTWISVSTGPRKVSLYKEPAA